MKKAVMVLVVLFFLGAPAYACDGNSKNFDCQMRKVAEEKTENIKDRNYEFKKAIKNKNLLKKECDNNFKCVMRDAVFEKKETTSAIMQEFKEDKKEVKECRFEDKEKCSKDKRHDCDKREKCDKVERHECNCRCGKGGSKPTPTTIPVSTPSPIPTVEVGHTPTPSPTIQAGVGGANPENFSTPTVLPRAGSDMLFFVLSTLLTGAVAMHYRFKLKRS